MPATTRDSLTLAQHPTTLRERRARQRAIERLMRRLAWAEQQRLAAERRCLALFRELVAEARRGSSP
jgi:hypothetical protein